jgi:cell division protein FtsL
LPDSPKSAKMQNWLNIPKPIWFMIIVIFALLGSIIGVSTHIDTLQFQEINQLNDKIHELDKQVAINNERILEAKNENQNYHPSP